ncbi:MAG TPA: adenylate kinase [Anaerolineae bacterium]|nr:adenylate kinase [Anaerolineae bacterium]
MAGDPTYVVLLGAPGAGKGTQARLLEEALGLPQVASGDLFRKHLKNQTELGRLASQYMDRGDLVPDDVTIAMVMDRLGQPDCARGAILDGFPRTVAQAEALAKALHERGYRITVVPYIKVSERELLERLSGRWICRNCQATYHMKFNPPKQVGVCDVCGGELYQRPDDTEKTARNRLRVYFEQTAPLIEYYRQRGLLAEIDGEQTIEQVQHDLLDVIRQAKTGGLPWQESR